MIRKTDAHFAMVATQAAAKPRTVRVLMWSVSSPWADFLFDVSNWTLIAGAFAVFVGTIGSITMGTAKEYFANERLAANEAATEHAKAEAEVAKEGAAKANAQALEAHLALERYKEPRSLTRKQIVSVEQEIRQFAGTPFVLSVRDTPESRNLLAQLRTILIAAGWQQKPWSSGGDIVLTIAGQPAIGFNSLVGVYVQADQTHAAELGPSAVALATALKGAGIGARSEIGAMHDPMDKSAIHIQVGEKPQ